MRSGNTLRWVAVAAAVAVSVPALAREADVTSGNVRIHYVEKGPASAKTLVFIPGWSTSAAIWKKQIADFSKTLHVVAIDPRSQGQSSKTDDGNTPEQRARDYETVFKALKLHDMVLIGWSQGVQDVAAYVSQYGTTRLSGAVLVDAAVSKGAALVSKNPRFVEGLLRNIDIYARNRLAYLEGMMHAIISRQLAPTEFKGLIDTAMKTPTASGIAMLVADMLGPDRTGALAKFTVPTLVIAASNSFELAQQKAEVAKLPHGRFEQIDHSAHAVFIDQPETSNRMIGDFVWHLH